MRKPKITDEITLTEWNRWQAYQSYRVADPSGTLWARVRHLTNLADKRDLDPELRRAIDAVDTEVGYYVNQTCYSNRPPRVTIEQVKENEKCRKTQN